MGEFLPLPLFRSPFPFSLPSENKIGRKGERNSLLFIFHLFSFSEEEKGGKREERRMKSSSFSLSFLLLLFQKMKTERRNEQENGHNPLQFPFSLLFLKTKIARNTKEASPFYFLVFLILGNEEKMRTGE